MHNEKIPHRFKTKIFHQCVDTDDKRIRNVVLHQKPHRVKPLIELRRELCSEFFYGIESEMKRYIEERESQTYSIK